jgi:hypothetical protein
MSQSIHSITMHDSATVVCAGPQAAQVGVEDVSRAYTLFLDVQRSTQYLVDNADQVRSHDGAVPGALLTAHPVCSACRRCGPRVCGVTDSAPDVGAVL